MTTDYFLSQLVCDFAQEVARAVSPQRIGDLGDCARGEQSINGWQRSEQLCKH